MTVAWLTLTLAGATFAGVLAVASLAVWLLWPAVSRRLARRPAADRARRLLGWRQMPTIAAVSVAAVAAVSFALLEPHVPGERPGWTLVLLSAVALAVVGTVAARMVGHLLATRRLVRTWTAGAVPTALPGVPEVAWQIESAFPVAAVIGFRTARLVIARAVVDRCSASELAAIAAHERGHVAARDNLKRLWLMSLVDGLTATRRSDDIVRAWQQATEDAADEFAAASGVRGVDLASALVAVARLAPQRQLDARLTLACFYRDGDIARRVCRLAGAPAAGDPPVPRSGRRRGWMVALATGLAGVVLTAGAGRAIHATAEWLVQSLP